MFKLCSERVRVPLKLGIQLVDTITTEPLPPERLFVFSPCQATVCKYTVAHLQWLLPLLQCCYDNLSMVASVVLPPDYLLLMYCCYGNKMKGSCPPPFTLPTQTPIFALLLGNMKWYSSLPHPPEHLLPEGPLMEYVQHDVVGDLQVALQNYPFLFQSHCHFIRHIVEVFICWDVNTTIVVRLEGEARDGEVMCRMVVSCYVVGQGICVIG